MDHIKLMDERRSREEYDMPQAHPIMQNEWMNMLSMLESIRLNMQFAHFNDANVRSFMLGSVISHTASVVQGNLNVARQQ
jgi:ADP-dependent phosphofructokinase/glucokinase